MAMGLEFGNQVALAVHARVRHDPDVSVQRKWLAFAFRFGSSFEQSMAETDRAIQPGLLRIRAAERLEIRQLPQDEPVGGCTIHIEDSDDSAHLLVWSKMLASAGTSRTQAFFLPERDSPNFKIGRTPNDSSLCASVAQSRNIRPSNLTANGSGICVAGEILCRDSGCGSLNC